MNTSQFATVSVETDCETYEVSADMGRVTGTVYWVAGDVTFPDSGWNDFVLVIASWWLEALKTLSSSNDSVVFRFMDGPFFVECSCKNGAVHGKFIDHRRKATVVSEWTALLADIANQIRNFARKVLDYCEKQQVCGRDVIKLQSELDTKQI